MAINTDRSSAIRGKTIRLKIQYYDSEGNAVDADSTPSVKITNSVGGVEYTESNAQVSRESAGLYYFDFSVDTDDPEGMYEDSWMER